MPNRRKASGRPKPLAATAVRLAAYDGGIGKSETPIIPRSGRDPTFGLTVITLSRLSECPMKLNSCLIKSTIVAALGGFLFGFDTAVISGTTSALRQTYGLSDKLLGLTVSSALLGTILGAMFAGIPGERIGRRDSLRILAVLYLISALGCAAAWNWPSLVIFRIIGG